MPGPIAGLPATLVFRVFSRQSLVKFFQSPTKLAEANFITFFLNSSHSWGVLALWSHGHLGAVHISWSILRGSRPPSPCDQEWSFGQLFPSPLWSISTLWAWSILRGFGPPPFSPWSKMIIWVTLRLPLPWSWDIWTAPYYFGVWIWVLCYKY